MCLLIVVLFGAPATAQIYSSDFETGPVGAEWSSTAGALQISTTPRAPARRFLGRHATYGLGNETVSLQLSGLPAHDVLVLSFDLYIIQSWDGNAEGVGPDHWQVGVRGAGGTLLHTTFTNVGHYMQSYPGPYRPPPNTADHPPHSQAAEVNSLGYAFYGDSVYSLSFTFPHSAPSLVADFRAWNLQSISDESWGLDNVQVLVTQPVPPTLSWLGTPGYRTDGVDPNGGEASHTRFRFRVRYADANANAPKLMYLNLRRKGNREAVREVAMIKGPGAYHSVVYRCSRKLPLGKYEYRFQARDRDGWATGEPTKWRSGPIIETPPTLTWVGTTGFESDGVDPDQGISDQTWFRFKVLYRDADGHAPKRVTLSIRRNGRPAAFREVAMIKGVGTYARGIVYRRRVRLPAGTYEYRFHSRDQNGFATGPATRWTAGPILNGGPQVTIASLAMAQTHIGTQITFSLSSAAQVQARVLNIAGRPIKTLCHAKNCDAGTNTLLWNAQSDAGLRVPNGTYLVEVTAKAADGAQTRALTQVRLNR